MRVKHKDWECIRLGLEPAFLASRDSFSLSVPYQKRLRFLVKTGRKSENPPLDGEGWKPAVGSAGR